VREQPSASLRLVHGGDAGRRQPFDDGAIRAFYVPNHLGHPPPPVSGWWGDRRSGANPNWCALDKILLIPAHAPDGFQSSALARGGGRGALRYGQRAARTVNLTQPAITQGIAKLERDIGAPLFERRPGGMEPTEAARILAPRAEAALKLVGSSRVTAPQMRSFIALARGGSYAAAAAATGVREASVHRAVADLALGLGERLVERRGRRVALTPAASSPRAASASPRRSCVPRFRSWIRSRGARSDE
jgi:molybdenum-dependent DNA-binding transcriptional regulator ModE